MLGGSCSPCCGICKLYEPEDEISVSVVVPYVQLVGTWDFGVGCSQGDFQPVAGSPVGIGIITLSLQSFSGTAYRYTYSRTDSLAPQLGQCDQSAYNAWLALDSNSRPVPSISGVISRTYFVEMILYPLARTGVPEIDQFSPPRTIATSENPPTFGRVGDLCGLADFFYSEISAVRWSHGLISSHYFAMQPVGKLQYTTQHQSATLPPVWTGSDWRPSVGSDGVDRTQYSKWTYDPYTIMPNGTIVRSTSVKQPVLFLPFSVQYQSQLYGASTTGDAGFAQFV